MDDEQAVTEWKAWRTKVDAMLAGLVGRSAGPAKTEPLPDPPAPEPEPVKLPKAAVEPPPEPTKDEPAPTPVRGPLHRMLFG